MTAADEQRGKQMGIIELLMLAAAVIYLVGEDGLPWRRASGVREDDQDEPGQRALLLPEGHREVDRR
jgi:hypothetical protein